MDALRIWYDVGSRMGDDGSKMSSLLYEAFRTHSKKQDTPYDSITKRRSHT